MSVLPTATTADNCGGCIEGTCMDYGNNYYVCECRTGFVGEHCEETFIEFVHGKEPGSAVNTEVIIIVTVISLAVIITAICGYLVWRRYTRNRERHQWVKWQETRRQSKATIEGFTTVEPTPCPAKENSSFGIQLLKNLSCGKVFTFHHDTGDCKDVEKQTSKPNWIATIQNEHKGSLPVQSAGSSDSQISIVFNQDRISFLTYSPGCCKNGSAQTGVMNLSEISSSSAKESLTSSTFSISKQISESEKETQQKGATQRSDSKKVKTAERKEEESPQDDEKCESRESGQEPFTPTESLKSSLSVVPASRGRRLSFAHPAHDIIHT
ncbi:uncharacterized protein LOC143467221 [Clavelina lepadiformis]|uniref:uncharacterized protein LOC143467221 n=1 Tax=Clavelina lepadiformis TaxID=159417 RepID=UPI004042CB9E